MANELKEIGIVEAMDLAVGMAKSFPEVGRIESDNDHKSGQVWFELGAPYTQEYVITVVSRGGDWDFQLRRYSGD